MAAQTPVWFITGASSGFGKHTALEALSRGHKVIASARNTSRIADLAEKGAFTIALDVAWPLAEIEKVAKTANEKYGYINHVVNAAGYALAGAIEETSPEQDLAIFTTNVFGTLNTCKAFLPYLRASPNTHRTIANFGSIASWIGWAGSGLYSGTKFAISGISEAMRDELAPLGIAVTVVEAGFFRTNVLGPGVMMHAENVLACYEETAVGASRKVLAATDGAQPGDVAKGSKVLVDVLLMEGGREVPPRIALGSDARGIIGGKCEATLKLLEEWDEVVTKTDLEG